MLRQLVSLALVGVAALPVFAQWVCVPQRPVYTPPVVCVIPCPPAASPTPLPPPRVTQEPTLPMPKPMPKELPPPESAVRPATGEAVPTPAVPTPAVPTPAQPEPPKLVPKITVDPAPTPKIEPLQLPLPGPIAEPKSAVPNEPEAVKIPPLTPRLPGTDSGLPPLSLPPVANESTSRSSPLSAKPRAAVEVFPVDGSPLASPTMKRTIGFFNHTDRDLTLTVDGETITLPKRHQVTATVAAKFRWKFDDSPERTTEVPTTAPGVEVVFRK